MEKNHVAGDGKDRTLDDLVVGEVQVEQEQHVQQSQSPTEQQARSLTNRAGQQNRHLVGDQMQQSTDQLSWGGTGLTGKPMLTMRRVASPPSNSHRM